MGRGTDTGTGTAGTLASSYDSSRPLVDLELELETETEMEVETEVEWWRLGGWRSHIVIVVVLGPGYGEVMMPKKQVVGWSLQSAVWSL